MNIQFQKSTIWLIVRASLALSLSGTVLGQQAPSEKPAAILLTFSPHDSEISCPKEVHAKDRCLLVTGKNVLLQAKMLKSALSGASSAAPLF
jgi:hypothetical protein